MQEASDTRQGLECEMFFRVLQALEGTAHGAACLESHMLKAE
jgi:hypothetical protein